MIHMYFDAGKVKADIEDTRDGTEASAENGLLPGTV